MRKKNPNPALDQIQTKNNFLHMCVLTYGPPNHHGSLTAQSLTMHPLWRFFLYIGLELTAANSFQDSCNLKVVFKRLLKTVDVVGPKADEILNLQEPPRMMLCVSQSLSTHLYYRQITEPKNYDFSTDDNALPVIFVPLKHN